MGNKIVTLIKLIVLFAIAGALFAYLSNIILVALGWIQVIETNTILEVGALIGAMFGVMQYLNINLAIGRIGNKRRK